LGGSPSRWLSSRKRVQPIQHTPNLILIKGSNPQPDQWRRAIVPRSAICRESRRQKESPPPQPACLDPSTSSV
jgi:hypothetical protein